MQRRDFLKAAILIPASVFVYGKKAIPSGFMIFDESYLIEEKLKQYENIDSELAISEIIGKIGEDLLGTDYEAGTLDININHEELILKISGMDCVTFVENVLTFARLVKQNNLNLESFKNELTNIRYRSGVIEDYSSRLHYFCDWIFDNESKKIVRDISKESGGIRYDKTIDFMSKHKKSYGQLKNDITLFEKISAIEDEINTRRMYYIKKSDIKKNESGFKTGDIVALTTSIEGLDVTHTGFIYKEGENVLFMHASQKAGKVIISEEGLRGYINSVKKCTGIMLARPVYNN